MATKEFNPRALSDKFITDLLDENRLNALVRVVRQDRTLDLEMRGDKVIVYYGGGKVLTCYDGTNPAKTMEGLDNKYIKNKAKDIEKYAEEGVSVPKYPDVPTILFDEDKTLEEKESALVDYFAKAKIAIESYEMCIEKKNGEGEIRQRIVRENNYSVNAEHTDYFITDTEWQDGKLGGRADIVGFERLRRTKKLKLTIIEVKQGTAAIETKRGSSGLIKHFNDFKRLSTNSEHIELLKNDMLKILSQKYQLGLIDESVDILFEKDKNGNYIFTGEILTDINFVVALTNYVPGSTMLNQELNQEVNGIVLNDDCKFFLSTFCGYGIYSCNVVPYSEFKKISENLYKKHYTKSK